MGVHTSRIFCWLNEPSPSAASITSNLCAITGLDIQTIYHDDDALTNAFTGLKGNGIWHIYGVDTKQGNRYTIKDFKIRLKKDSRVEINAPHGTPSIYLSTEMARLEAIEIVDAEPTTSTTYTLKKPGNHQTSGLPVFTFDKTTNSVSYTNLTLPTPPYV